MKAILFRIVFVLVVLAGGIVIVYCGSNKSGGDADGGGETDGSKPVACKASSDCNVAAGETCLGSKCVKIECKTNTDCKDASKQCCNVTTYQCAPCGAPDAGSDGGGDASDGGAKGCASRDDCKPDKWCDIADTGAGVCQPMGTCQTDIECASGFVCNSFNKVCECLNDDSCKDWPNGNTHCDGTSKQCTQPVVVDCNPPCDAACQDCVNAQCQLKSGLCCGDNDCITPPALSCDLASHTCVQADTCADACTGDQDCKTWCNDPSFVCDTTNSTCGAQTCTVDGDCAAACAPQNGTCAGGTCSCTPVMAGLCADCSADATVCDAAGLKCGTMTKKCYTTCKANTDCVDSTGQMYECFMGYVCNCNSPVQPSCCNPACVAPEVCDEGGTCTCKAQSNCNPACVAPQVCDENAGVCTNCNPPCTAPQICNEVASTCTCCDPVCAAPQTCDEGATCTCK